MESGLFEILRGTFADGTPVREIAEDRRRLLSVVDNLNRLFNSRRGMLEHLPAYGLPDTGDVYSDSPEAAERLRRAIKETVEKYEPRLRRISVTPGGSEDDQHARIVFLVSGELVSGERVEFQTIFVTESSVEVKPQRINR